MQFLLEHYHMREGVNPKEGRCRLGNLRVICYVNRESQNSSFCYCVMDGISNPDSAYIPGYEIPRGGVILFYIPSIKKTTNCDYFILHVIKHEIIVLVPTKTNAEL